MDLQTALVAGFGLEHRDSEPERGAPARCMERTAAGGSHPWQGDGLAVFSLQMMADDLHEILSWLTTLLAELEIPYQVVGGLAAQAYGARRPLVDIDLYVPEESSLARIAKAVSPHLTRAPTRHQDEHWDLVFLSLLRGTTRIEVAAASSAKVWNRRTGAWTPAAIAFEASEERLVHGVQLAVMPRAQLVDYKLGLDRAVDRLDLQQMAT